MFGNAYSVLSSTTKMMVRYLKRPYSSIDGSRASRRWPVTPQSIRSYAGSGRLERALGQDVGDRALLHAHAHVVGDLDADEAVADLAHHAGDAAVGDDFVAVAELLEHGAVFL